MDRYKAELEPENEGPENDILNEIERSEKNSKKSENSNSKISEKRRSRVESIKNEEQKNERFVVTKDPEIYDPEAEPMPEPLSEKYGDDFE